MNISKQLFRNTIAGWLEMAVLIISALVITPLLITQLGKEGYGVWMLVGQVIAYLAILDLGVGSSVGRFVAKYNAGKDYTSLSRTVSSAMFLFLVSSILIMFATLILWPNFSKLFNLSAEYFNTGRWLVLITGLGVALAFPLKIGQGILEGTHCFHLIYLFRASGAFFKLLLIAFLFGLLRHNSLLLLAAITVVVTVLPNLLMCGTAYRKFSNVSLGFTHVKLSSLKEIWSLSLTALLGTLATLLFNQGQVLSVGRIIGPETVTLYAIPIMLLTYGSMITAYIVAAFKPMASHMQALNKKQSLRELDIGGVKVSMTICLFIAVAAIAFGHPFFRIWLSSKALSVQDLTVLSNVLTIMVIGFAIGVPQSVTSKILSGTDRQWFVALTSLVASLIGLCVGLVLMLKTSLGLYGMATGWATVFFVKGVLVLPVTACRHFKINPYSYIQQAYLPPLVVAAILAVAAYSIRHFFSAISIVSLTLSIISCLVVYTIAVYFICLDNNQKKIVRNTVATIRASLLRN